MRLLATLLLTAASALMGSTYDAGLGTLPTAQGFTYVDVTGNPAPAVINGLLHDVSTSGGQYWMIPDTVDFSGHVTLTADLRINSSNYVPNIGTGTREGYYLALQDINGLDYIVGLASQGFNINTISVPNQPLTPYPVAGSFHIFTIDVNNFKASFSIDGNMLASNIAPSSGLVGSSLFGPSAGASRSDSDLRTLCVVSGSGTCPTAAATPEAASLYLVLSGILVLTAKKLKRRTHCPRSIA